MVARRAPWCARAGDGGVRSLSLAPDVPFTGAVFGLRKRDPLVGEKMKISFFWSSFPVFGPIGGGGRVLEVEEFFAPFKRRPCCFESSISSTVSDDSFFLQPLFFVDVAPWPCFPSLLDLSGCPGSSVAC
ncbi:hypothetical protein V6N11_074669 [Hibiscus sabdariffa]|uniref:Uncharacterized protein n=1 Tax=Hibiscus sabdariffa TaxID=183260 RepID=A0ABR2R478_9ROSI